MGKESYHSFQQTLVGKERVMNPLDRLRGRLITCKTCGLQYVGSTKTQFTMRFDNHKTGIRRHENLVHVQRDQDDLIYKHFLGGDIRLIPKWLRLYHSFIFMQISPGCQVST